MKKKILAFTMAVVMIFTVGLTPVYATDGKEAVTSFFKNVLVNAISFVVEGLTSAVNSVVRENDKFVDEADFELTNFYEGTTETLDKAAENAKWSLGYDTRSLVPENYKEMELYIGGFIDANNKFSNKVEGLWDDMKVRTIALADGSGRGVSVFATIDAIGLANADVRYIRSMLSEFAKENNINSINIYSTHCHSCIDTQGLWTNAVPSILENLVTGVTGWGKLGNGVNKDYMQFLYETVSKSVETAVNGMTKGEMTFAQKDITSTYFNNKNREQATALMTNLTRFTFTPDDKSVQPTMIVNMAAHPDCAGLPTGNGNDGRHISGDYVYYLGETLEQAGYNFMFFNGAIAGIYTARWATGDGVDTQLRVEDSARYGREIGRMTLAMTMTEAEIKADSFLSVTGDTEEQMASGSYTLWYKNWQPVSEEKVEPLLNITLKSIRIQVTNNIVMVAGKLNLANYTVIKADGKYYVSTEIGTMNIGSHKIAMVPGEFCQDLVLGGASLTASGSCSGKDFEGKTLADIFGDDVIVFGLANDAIGYIVPDNDYAVAFAFGHYQESLSLGKNTASTIISEFEKIGD